jgi:hypothetical protein
MLLLLEGCPVWGSGMVIAPTFHLHQTAAAMALHACQPSSSKALDSLTRSMQLCTRSLQLVAWPRGVVVEGGRTCTSLQRLTGRPFSLKRAAQ